MGYNSYITGGAQITPPLSEKDIKQNHWGPDDADYTYFILTDAGEEDTVGLVNGEITVIPGNRYTDVTFRFDEASKFYDMDGQCQALVDWCKKRKATITGAFTIYGEESADISRVRFDGTNAIGERPELVWPNGDREAL